MTDEEADKLAVDLVNQFMAINDHRLGANRVVYLVAVGKWPGAFQIATNVTAGGLDTLLNLVRDAVGAYLRERESGIPEDMPRAN